MGPQRIRMGIFGAALALGLVLLLLVFRPHVAPLRPAIAALRTEGKGAAASPAEPAAAVSATNLGERSRLVEGLNSPQGDVHSDLRMLNALFIAYRGATHAGNPVGENNEITAVLRGKKSPVDGGRQWRSFWGAHAPPAWTKTQYPSPYSPASLAPARRPS
jgi:hypothetical protein